MPTLEGYDHLSDFTHSSTTETQKLAITPTTSSNRHLIVGGWQGHESQAAGDWANARPRINANYVLGGDFNTFSAYAEYSSGVSHSMAGGFAFVEAPGGDMEIYVDVDSTGFGAWRNMWLIGIDVEDIADDTTQMVYSQSVPSGTLVDANTWKEYDSITVTPNVTGEKWLIFAAGSVRQQGGGNGIQKFQLLDGDDTQLAFSDNHNGPGGTANFSSVICLTYLWTAPDTSAETFHLQMQSNSGTSLPRASTVIAVRLDSLSSNYTVATPSDFTFTTTDDEEISGGGTTLTPSGSNDVLLLGAARNDMNGGENRDANLWVTKDSNTNQLPSDVYKLPYGWSERDATGEGFLTWGTVDTTPSGETAYEWWAHAETTSNILKDQLYIAMEMDEGDGGPSSGGSTTIRGDVSPQYIADLASAAGVTVTRGSILGQLNEIAGRTWPDYLEFEAAKEAAESAAGFS